MNFRSGWKMNWLTPFYIFLILLGSQKNQAFKNDYKISFQNGYPMQFLSGSIHYFRVHPTDWRDRLIKLRWAGFHAVQTYIEWSSHEPEPGVYDFSERFDVVKFIKTAAEEGLSVIVRPGPYICSERDMGGLPYWLLREEPMVRLRTSDERFMKYVRKWFGVLMPILKPLMYENGGPIAMVQVENEYGNWHACDFEYITELARLLKVGLGKSTFLFSTDNGKSVYLKCSKIPTVFAAVDFGPDVNATEEFRAQRLFNGGGPMINSEFHVGWFDHWGSAHHTKGSELVSSFLRGMLSMGASVNIYMFLGGTSFGMGSGSNLDQKFQATPTSYDFDAPLNEAGDLTEKYYAIRNVVKEYFPVPSGPAPSPSRKYRYGKVGVFPLVSVFDLLPFLAFEISKNPKTFEELAVPNGLVVYETVIQHTISSPGIFSIFDVHDRGYIFIDKKLTGIASREEDFYTIPLSAAPNQTLTIIVESQGRISVGAQLNDFKGLTTTPLLNGHIVSNWKMTPIPLYNIEVLRRAIFYSDFIGVDAKAEADAFELREQKMMFYEATFFIPMEAPHPADTFLRLDSFSKGYVWINDFLLGRYWNVVGPQMTLYVPHGVLRQGENSFLVLELEAVTQDGPLHLSLLDTAEIDGPTPYRANE